MGQVKGRYRLQYLEEGGCVQGLVEITSVVSSAQEVVLLQGLQVHVAGEVDGSECGVEENSYRYHLREVHIKQVEFQTENNMLHSKRRVKI